MVSAPSPEHLLKRFYRSDVNIATESDQSEILILQPEESIYVAPAGCIELILVFI